YGDEPTITCCVPCSRMASHSASSAPGTGTHSMSSPGAPKVDLARRNSGSVTRAIDLGMSGVRVCTPFLPPELYWCPGSAKIYGYDFQCLFQMDRAVRAGHRAGGAREPGSELVEHIRQPGARRTGRGRGGYLPGRLLRLAGDRLH